MAKKGMGLEKFKELYEELRVKHGLPEFTSMNEDFYIEKISDVETEIPIREIRKYTGDKLVNYMRFVENLLNPVNVPMFVFSIVKLLEPNDKKKLEEIYKELMNHELKFIELDLEFNEEKEAEFIKNSFSFWQETKKSMLEIIDKINKKSEDKSEQGSKGYFG